MSNDDPLVLGRLGVSAAQWEKLARMTSRRFTRELDLMVINADSGEVFQTGADRNGTSFTGKWQLPKYGDAVLEVAFRSGASDKGSPRIRYYLANDDTLVVTVELPQPVTLKMIRMKETAKP